MRTSITLSLTAAGFAAIAVAGYAYRAPIQVAADRAIFGPPPCSEPIPYRIGVFDERFGESRADFLGAVAQAAAIWDAAAGRDLFRYDATNGGGDLAINLIYDSRQQVTNDLKSIDNSISSDKSSYDALKEQYQTLTTAYDQAKTQFAAAVSRFDAEKTDYKNQVDYWNSQGGAPQAQYQALQQEQQSLAAESADLLKQQDSLNQSVQEINDLAASINKVAGDVNSKVSTYNTIGSANGAEFDEGLYVQDGADHHIDIYQYDTRDRLVRVLAHELGHALGLQHVDDPKAIMYKLNQSTNEKPTAADLGELSRVCAL